MNPYQKVAEFSPTEFEEHVRTMLQMSGIDLKEFRTSVREKVTGVDGEYEIDVVARFSALNTSFMVLIECKHHKNPIKREVVQVLRDRMNSTGAQKGMVFSTAEFQSGALEYARRHNIALVKVTDSEPVYISRSAPIHPNDIPTRKGAWLVRYIEEGKTQFTTLGLYEPKTIFKALGIETDDDDDLIEISFEE